MRPAYPVFDMHGSPAPASTTFGTAPCALTCCAEQTCTSSPAAAPAPATSSCSPPESTCSRQLLLGLLLLPLMTVLLLVLQGLLLLRLYRPQSVCLHSLSSCCQLPPVGRGCQC